jgi:hypothetical protein
MPTNLSNGIDVTCCGIATAREGNKMDRNGIEL